MPRPNQASVLSSPDTSTQNMHLMTEARPSVESRCKWYSSWRYRWVCHPSPHGHGHKKPPRVTLCLGCSPQERVTGLGTVPTPLGTRFKHPSQ